MQQKNMARAQLPQQGDSFFHDDLLALRLQRIACDYSKLLPRAVGDILEIKRARHQIVRDDDREFEKKEIVLTGKLK
jgi:hypothetical protein